MLGIACILVVQLIRNMKHCLVRDTANALKQTQCTITKVRQQSKAQQSQQQKVGTEQSKEPSGNTYSMLLITAVTQMLTILLTIMACLQTPF